MCIRDRSFSSFSNVEDFETESENVICSFTERDFGFMCRFKSRCEVVDSYTCYESTLNAKAEKIINWDSPIYKELRYMTVSHWDYVLQWWNVDNVEIEEINE